MVVKVNQLRIDPVQFFFRQKSQKLPAQIQRLLDGPVLCWPLADVTFLKFLPEFQILFIQRRQLVFSDNGSQVPGLPHLGVGGEQLASPTLA